MAFDVARVRGLYPTLGGGTAHLDGSFGSLQPESVIRAIITTLRAAPIQPGSSSHRSARTADSVRAARRAVADLIGAVPSDVVLGGNLSTLLARFAALASRDWQLGDEIVLNRLDHDSNIRPWLAAARQSGVVVRWAEADLETGELPTWQYEKLINRRTRIVTLPLANPSTGMIPEVATIAELAHHAGALVVVDAGAAIPHRSIDITLLDADIIGIAARTFGGPSVGALVAREGLLALLDSDTPGPIPERFELGSLPIELLDGLTASVDHLAGLDEQAIGSRRERLQASFAAVAAYEHGLLARLDAKLRELPGVTVLGSSTDRVPVLAFTVRGNNPEQVGKHMAAHDVSVWTGSSGMSQLMSALGVDELGGAVHVGLMPHTTRVEVDQLIRTLARVVA